MKLLSAIAIAVAVSQGQVAQPPPSKGTATIKGKVIDKESGAPIRRAVVSLRPMIGNAVQQNYTNEDGVFEFRQIAAGRYELRASPGEYRVTHVEMGLSPALAPPGSPSLQITDGEERTDIVIALPRAHAISGRVIDEDGQPLANVEIALSPERFFGGGRPRTTDDRGTFRIYGLVSGKYRVCADNRRGPTFDAPLVRRVQYVRTCYPSAVDPSEADDVTVAELDVTGLEIRMVRRPTFLIAGQVLAANGALLENAQINVTRFDGNRSSGTGTRLSANGMFQISNVTPGTYEISARLGRSERTFEPDEREPQWGGMRLEVTTADIEGILIPLKRGVSLKGTVTFDEPPQSGAGGKLQVWLRPPDGAGDRPRPMPATVADDGTFELKELFGELLVSLGGSTPRNYLPKSILYRGRDVSYIPVEFDGDPAHSLQIILTNKTAELSGQVLDETGSPVRATVVHFPADPARWRAFQGPQVTTAASGRYRIGGLVAGEYFVAALPQRESFDSRLSLQDYEQLATVAQRVTVLENERRTADLQLSTVPPRKK